MKIYNLIISILLINSAAFAQNIHKFVKLNSIQLEASGGDDSFVPISINYERIFYSTQKLAWNVKIGGIYKNWGDTHQKAITAELGVISQGIKHHWEVGLFTMHQDKKRYETYKNNTLITLSAPWYMAVRGGYRYQTVQGKWLFRAGLLLPLIKNFSEDSNEKFSPKFKAKNLIMPWPVISLGRAF